MKGIRLNNKVQHRGVLHFTIKYRAKGVRANYLVRDPPEDPDRVDEPPEYDPPERDDEPPEYEPPEYEPEREDELEVERTLLLVERVDVLDERTDEEVDAARVGAELDVERTVEVVVAGCVRVAVEAAAARLVAVVEVVARADDERDGEVAVVRVVVEVLAVRVAVEAERVAVEVVRVAVEAERVAVEVVRVVVAAERVF